MRMTIWIAAFVLAPMLAAPCVAMQDRAQAGAQDTRPAPAARTPVNLNTAPIELLETLPGIGRRTAERIIEYRKKTPFTKIEQLMNVKGIGEKSFLRLKPLVVVTPSPAEKTSPQQ